MRYYFGFTLLELLIALVITAILASIAYPSYIAQTVRANRNRAEVVLMQLAARMEVYANDHENSYEDVTLTDLHANQLSENLSYTLKISEASGEHFTLEAIPIDNQADRDSHCGTLTLTDTNTRLISGNGAVLQCWR